MDAIFYDDNPLPGETGEDFQEEDFQEEVDNEDKLIMKITKKMK